MFAIRRGNPSKTRHGTPFHAMKNDLGCRIAEHDGVGDDDDDGDNVLISSAMEFCSKFDTRSIKEEEEDIVDAEFLCCSKKKKTLYGTSLEYQPEPMKAFFILLSYKRLTQPCRFGQPIISRL